MKLRLVLATVVSLWAASAAASPCVLPGGCAGGAWRAYYAAPIYPFYPAYGAYGAPFGSYVGAWGAEAWDGSGAERIAHPARLRESWLPRREPAGDFHEIVPMEIRLRARARR